MKRRKMMSFITRPVTVISFSAVIIFVILLLVIRAVIISQSDFPSKETQVATVKTVGGVGNDIIVSADTASEVYAIEDGDTRKLAGDIDSEYGILLDLKNNKVLASKGGDDKIYPASMTKMMTLIVAVEHAKSLDDTFEMTIDITDPLYVENASVAGFLPGEIITVRDLIYGLILPSGADGACALALYTSGSEENFVKLMNEKAEELGLKNTRFANATGLHDENQYSTCHEMGLILKYALQDEFMRTVLSQYTYVTSKTPQHPEGITLYSTLLSRAYGDEAGGMFILGGKTGYTPEAGNCLASFAVKYDPLTESEDMLSEKIPEYIFVTAKGAGKWVPIFDAINTYATVTDPDALETRQYSAR